MKEKSYSSLFVIMMATLIAILLSLVFYFAYGHKKDKMKEDLTVTEEVHPIPILPVDENGIEALYLAGIAGDEKDDSPTAPTQMKVFLEKDLSGSYFFKVTYAASIGKLYAEDMRIKQQPVIECTTDDVKEEKRVSTYICEKLNGYLKNNEEIKNLIGNKYHVSSELHRPDMQYIAEDNLACFEYHITLEVQHD